MPTDLRHFGNRPEMPFAARFAIPVAWRKLWDTTIAQRSAQPMQDLVGEEHNAAHVDETCKHFN